MELRVLRYFLTVVREENISKAADILHITQPTLSRQLAQLEEELGVQLFTRGRGVSLTEEGMLLRRRAEELVELADKTRREFLEQRRELAGTISVGSGESASAQLLPELLSSFHENYPRVRFDLYTGNADQIKEGIDRGLLDVALLFEPVSIEKYESIPLGRLDRWGVSVLPEDPLAERERVTPEELRGRPLIISRRPLVQQMIARWCGVEPEQLPILATYNLGANVRLLAEAGLGAIVGIEGAHQNYAGMGLKFIPLSPELTMRSVLVWKKLRLFQPAVQRFLEHIGEWYRQGKL